MGTFTNTHLSYSRLSRFESCPLSFKFQYIDRLPSEPGMPLRFGKVVHAALESLYREIIEQERIGSIDEERAVSLFADAWGADKLTGLQEFGEGVAMLRSYVRAQGVVDHRDVLAVEKEFRLQAGRFTVLGFIDRVDRIDDETIEIVDYKTNRQLFTREEVDTSLQMSLYELAARRIWPWAKRVRLTFEMLRHGIRQTTTRTSDQLDAALGYVETLGRMTEEAVDFPARISGNCAYCDHRAHCGAYAEALKGKRTVLGADPADLEAVAREREEVSRLAKILYARKSELEGVLKEHLRERDELVLAGVRYSLAPTSASVTYPLRRTLRVLEERTGLPHEEVLERVVAIDREALDRLVRETTNAGDKAKGNLLRAELQALAERAMTTRFTAKAVRT
jgi:putative RecB family exonuclease